MTARFCSLGLPGGFRRRPALRHRLAHAGLGPLRQPPARSDQARQNTLTAACHNHPGRFTCLQLPQIRRHRRDDPSAGSDSRYGSSVCSSRPACGTTKAARSRGSIDHGQGPLLFRLAVQMAGPPLVLVGRRASGADKEAPGSRRVNRTASPRTGPSSPMAAGTSRTSDTLPRSTRHWPHASSATIGRQAQYRCARTVARPTTAGRRQADGQPIRSHEHDRPHEAERCNRLGANAPGQTGQSIAACRIAASVIPARSPSVSGRETPLQPTASLLPESGTDGIDDARCGSGPTVADPRGRDTYPMHNGDCKVIVASITRVRRRSRLRLHEIVLPDQWHSGSVLRGDGSLEAWWREWQCAVRPIWSQAV